jgi:hypothetical protein
MPGLLRAPFSFFTGLFRSPADLVAENVLLRQQLIVAIRHVEGRPRWTPWERLVMSLAAKVTSSWNRVVWLVQPATRAWLASDCLSRVVASSFEARWPAAVAARAAHS